MSTVSRVVPVSSVPLWTNVVGCVASGGTLTKTGIMEWGNAGAFSLQALYADGGSVEVRIADLTSRLTFGLSNVDGGQGYDTIPFGLYVFATNGFVMLSEGAITDLLGAIQVGDVLSVGIEGGAIKYRKNGTLLHTSATPPTFPLYFDCALFDAGAVLAGALMREGGSEAVGVGGSVVRV